MTTDKDDIPLGRCDAADLSLILGISPARVQQYARAGVLDRAADHSFDIGTSITRYLQSLRDAAANRVGRDPSVADDLADPAYSAALLSRNKRLLIEHRNKVKQAELVPAAMFQKVWANLVLTAESGLATLGERIAAALPGQLTKKDVGDLRKYLDDILVELRNQGGLIQKRIAGEALEEEIE